MKLFVYADKIHVIYFLFFLREPFKLQIFHSRIVLVFVFRGLLKAGNGFIEINRNSYIFWNE